MAAQRNIFVTLSRASLTLGAAIGLARVYDGPSWVIPIVLAAFVPPAVFAFTENRRIHAMWGVAASVVIGLALAITLDDPSETIAGIPTGAAVSNFGSDIANAPHVLRAAVVPVTVGGAALVLAFVATYIAALAADLIARYLDAPMGAIGPSVALYVAIAALGSGAWAATTACYALTVIAYLIALHHAEISARRTWFQSRRARRSQTLSGGAVAGLLAVAFAVAFGPLFPGARGDAWINYRKLGLGKTSNVLNAPSPFLSIATKLSRDSEAEIFTVKTSDNQPYKWRVIALDTFNGKSGEWGLDARQGSTSQLDPPTTKDDPAHVVQQFHITTSVDPYWLPAVYRPFQISLPGAAVLPDSSTLFLPRGSIAGVTYDVKSEVRLPSEPELRAVTAGDVDAMPEATRLPADFPQRVRKLADDITRRAATPYDRAAALEGFFQSDAFTYDQGVDYSSSPDALEEFVFEKRRGFCEQFAAAFAEMARAVHLPARVAVGYQPGTKFADGLFHVRGSDAHAWPEVWLGADIGWYPFEPTKGRADPTTHRGDPKAADSSTSSNGSSTTTLAPTGTTAPGTPPTLPNDSGVQIAPVPPSSGGGGGTGSRVVAGIGITFAVLVLGGIAALVVLIERAVRRTRRRRYAPDTRGRVLGAWNEALERLGAAGVVRRPSATSIEFALRVAPAHGAGGAGPPLMGLARLQTAAMFAPEPPTDEDADAAWSHVDEIDAAIRDSVPRGERWLTRLRIRGRDRRD